MKKVTTKLIIAGILLAMVSTLKAQPDSAGQKKQVSLEVYVPRVVIEAPYVLIPMGLSLSGIDDNGKSIQTYDGDGKLTTIEIRKRGVFGHRGEINNPTATPSDMDVDSVGNIYIFDPANERIQKFDKDGSYAMSIPVPNCYVWDTIAERLTHYKSHIALAPDASIYVLDERKLEVVHINQWGTVLGTESLVRKGKERVMEFREFLRGKVKTDIQDVKCNKQLNGNYKGSKNVIVKNSNYMIVNISDNNINIKTRFTIGGLDYLGVDISNNLYFEIDTRGTAFIRKYDKSSTLKAEFKAWPRKDIAFVFPEKRLVDQKGNYYELGIDERKSKVRIVRWERVAK